MNRYYYPKRIEKNGKIYKKLGIQYFVKITPFEILYLIDKKKRWSITKKNLHKYFRDTLKGELAHLISGSFFLLYSIILVFLNFKKISIVIFLINIVVNVYPIFLMRYNRFRIAKVLNKSVTELLEKK